MSKEHTCNICKSKMTEYDGNAWYTCPNCGQGKRDNGNGTWTWKNEIFRKGSKSHSSDFELADFGRGGDLTED